MMSELEAQFEQWRGYVEKRRTIADADVAELEDHLRNQVDDLVTSGLSEDEAFLVAVKRMGSLDDLSREFAREHSERLWKQLVLTGPAPTASHGIGRDLGAALVFAVLGAFTVRLAMSFVDDGILASNVGLIALPWVAAYLAWTRRPLTPALIAVPAAYVIGALVVNLYPWRHPTNAFESTTEILTYAHLPVVLWLVGGIAYAGGQWRSETRRMDFIRFTGEWVVYMALLALGGIVINGLAIGAFTALGLGNGGTIASWIIPMGAIGATVIAAWLVEAKQAVVENIAPVLTKVFTPVTLMLLVALLSALTVRRTFVDLDRDLLIVIDLILALVLGLVLYAISARDPQAPPDVFDRLQFVLLAVALATDAVLLTAMVARIADAGLTANKVAALGLNLVLLVNLIGSTRLIARFNRGAGSFASLERWQTGYLPVYGAWAAFVAFALPLFFGFA